MKLGALTLGAYKLIIVISFWCISPFIHMEYPSLSHLISVSLKSILSEISIAIPACFQGQKASLSRYKKIEIIPCILTRTQQRKQQQKIHKQLEAE
jgi:hypothetical protein